MWAYRQVGRTCHLTPVPPDLLVTFSFSVFKRRMTLSNTSPLYFTHLFSSSNMWCIYKYTYTHMPVYFNFEIWDSCAWLIWEGFIKICLWLIPARGDFFPLFFSWGDSKNYGHLKENCPTFIPFSIIFVSSVIKCILGVKAGSGYGIGV